MSFEIWLSFVAASVLLVLIPGPTVLLVMSYALSQGRKVAIATALGVAVGDLIAICASLFGIGALILASATLFTVLKWVGAAYLVFLGVKLLRNPPAKLSLEETEATPTTARKIFFHSMTVTALNPKSLGFFIAFVPQFINLSAPMAPQFALIIPTFVLIGGGNALIYALLADRLRQRIRKPSVLQWINRLGGSALVSMGALTAAMQRS